MVDQREAIGEPLLGHNVLQNRDLSSFCILPFGEDLPVRRLGVKKKLASEVVELRGNVKLESGFQSFQAGGRNATII